MRTRYVVIFEKLNETNFRCAQVVQSYLRLNETNFQCAHDVQTYMRLNKTNLSMRTRYVVIFEIK